MKMKKIVLLCILSLICSAGFSQTYTRTLMLKSKRMNGDDVKAVQTKLVELGFLPYGENDGWFGPMTKTAVQQYQLFYGLEPDGIAGKKTFTTMFNEASIKKYDEFMKDIISFVLTYANKNAFFNQRDPETGKTDDNLSFSISALSIPSKHRLSKTENDYERYSETIEKYSVYGSDVGISHIVGDGSGSDNLYIKFSNTKSVFMKQYWAAFGTYYSQPDIYVIENNVYYKINEGKLIKCGSADIKDVEDLIKDLR